MARTSKNNKLKDSESKVYSETTEELDKRAVNLVAGCKKQSLDFYDGKFKKFNYFDRLYIKGAAKTNVPYGRANLELPLAFQQIEPFVSQMTETMVSEAPYIAYDGRNADDEPIAAQITDFTQYQLDNGGFLPVWTSFARNLGKYGTGAMKIAWEYKTKEISNEVEVPTMQTDPLTGMQVQIGTEYKEQTEDMVEHDGPVFYNLSLFDFFVPRSATSSDVQKMDWCIHRTYKDLDTILQNPNYTRNRDRIKTLLSEQDDEYDCEEGSQLSSSDSPKRIEQQQKNPSKGSEKFDGKVEILEWWGDFRFKKSEPKKPALIVVAILGDDIVCLRVDENPFKFKFKPFLMSNDYVVDGEPYGYGELDHIKGLIEESTALRNARLDVANISLNRVWLVERAAGINLRELYTAPNKIILTNDLNGVKPMDMGGVTPSSVNELARIDFDIQNTTEIINPRQDVSSVGAAFGGTATGVNFLSAKANLRMLTKARLLESTFFKPLAQMLNWYNRDMVTDEMYYRVAGKDQPNPYGQTISPDAFLTPVDFKPTSNPEKLSIAEKKDNMAYLLQTVAQVEKVAPGTNNLFELMKQVYKLAGFPHPKRYVKDPQTTILQTPQNQLVDTSGKPVQVVPVDETGKPIQQQPAMGPQQ